MTRELTEDRTRFRRLRFTPLRDVVRGRLTGRLDLEALIAAAALPDPLPQLVRDVIHRTRLFRLEKVGVAEELVGHFRDGLDHDRRPDELASDFGDPVQAARLISRAKRRNRPRAYRAVVRSMQVTCGLIGVVLLLYGIAAARFFLGKPDPTVDFLQQLNATTLAARPEDRAWPEYRAAIMAFQRPPSLSYGRTPRPGEPGWEVVDEYLAGSRSALAHMRAGAARSVLGYKMGFVPTAEDLELWPGLKKRFDPLGENQVGTVLFGILRPHLSELRQLVRLLVDDARRAAARSDAETALADIQTVLSMAEQVLGSGFIIGDLSAVSMFTVGINAIGELLHDYADLFSDEQLTTLAHRLSGMAGGGPIRVSLEDERVAFADFVQHAYTDNGRGDGHLTWEGLRLLDGPRGTVTPSRLDMAIGPAVGALGASRAELMEEYDRLLAMVQVNAAVPLWERGRSPVDVEVARIMSSFTESVKFLPIAMLMPATGKVTVKAELLTQRRDAAQVVIALELYRRRHGAWPSDLQALVPLLLPEVPRDRFDGGPIKYVLRDGEPLLYVVGTDRDDDQGRTPAPKAESARYWRPLEEVESLPHRFDGDWVLWPPGNPDPLGRPEPHKAKPIYIFARYGW